MRERLVCSECGEIIYENPLPATAGVVLDNHNILLVKRGVEPGFGMWSLPGGFIELDETPENCMKRELREETGINATIHQLLGVHGQPSEMHRTVIVIGYLLDPIGGHLKAGDDASDAKWFPIGNTPELAFSSHRDFYHLARKILERKP